MQLYYITVGQVNLAKLDYVVDFILKNLLSEKKTSTKPF